MRHVKLTELCFVHQDSDDSDKEEEKSIKKEDVKERKGYKLPIEALRATLVKPAA